MLKPIVRGLDFGNKTQYLGYRAAGPLTLIILRELLVINMASNPIYKVIFYNQNQVYEVFAQAIYQSEMYGFIEVEELIFGERSGLLVDPAEEKLKSEFAGVKRSYVPMQSVIRIDEVEKEGTAKATDLKSGDKVAQFPSFMPGPSSD